MLAIKLYPLLLWVVGAVEIQREFMTTSSSSQQWRRKSCTRNEYSVAAGCWGLSRVHDIAAVQEEECAIS